MAEYKDSLNLPNTLFPMKANLADKEPKLLKDWEIQALYNQIREARKGCTPFVLHDGPPYANGHLHCGHALNKILKDMIVKSKTMSAYDAPFVPGWDCHGLPIELNVEKKHGKAGAKLSPTEFRSKCREYAGSQISIQREEFKRLGVLGAWQTPYVTMDFSYEANIVRALAKIIENGHLEQGFKPVHWCVDCGSALAEAEVEYEDKISPSIDVAFFAKEPALFLEQFAKDLTLKPVIVPIWTTTPWTLPANEAVCLHPQLTYVLLDVGQSYLLLAQDLMDTTLARYGRHEATVVAEIEGQALSLLLLKHPFQDRFVPIICGEHVTTDAGTGCVHTAPAHGPDDFIVGKAYQLPLTNPVLANGCYATDVPEFAGLSVFKSNEIIVSKMHDLGVLLHQETLHHSYPHCWRHKTPVIFRATPQWFISMDKNGLREKMLAQVQSVEWVPDWGKARITTMIENRPDWCISRQRSWGTPLPLFVHKQTRALHPNTLELMEKVALQIEKEGIDAWFNLDVVAFLGDDAAEYDKINDTLDVWFDSGVTHFCVLGRSGLSDVADVYFEGSDQHRGWFNSSLTTAVAIQGFAPYKTVLTHGYTVDAQGKKLSKSAGNYVELDKLIKQYGADVLRLWVASTDYRNEVSISDEIMKRSSEAYRRIRNTARFLLSNLFDFDPKTHSVSPNEMVELDKWAILRTQELQKEIIAAYEAYQFHLIYQKIHNFCTVDLGSFYLDIIKDRQYTCAKESVARRSCQTAMYHILEALTRWLAPILSYTAEEIWQYIPGPSRQSVFLSEWYQDFPKDLVLDMSIWSSLQQVRAEVNKALEVKRKDGLIGSGLEASVLVYAEGDLLKQLKSIGDELKFMLITSKVEVLPLEQASPDVYRSEHLALAIDVAFYDADKCERCWHRVGDLGQDPEHPTLCVRCVGNITSSHEIRRFA